MHALQSSRESSPAGVAGLEKILAQLGEGSWASQLAHAPLG